MLKGIWSRGVPLGLSYSRPASCCGAYPTQPSIPPHDSTFYRPSRRHLTQDRLDRPRSTTQGLFAPTQRESPKDVTSASQGYLLRAGMVQQYGPGLFTLLPLGHRILTKLTSEIHESMHDIGGQPCTMPSLVPADLWRRSGRWDSMGSELFRLQDRHGHDYCLGPTHEETFTEVVGRGLTSWKQLPWRLYQVGPKYRDEPRPRYGLIRGREFVMKDMYTFDRDEVSAEKTFHAVTAAYRRLFQRLKLPCDQVDADTGSIGGSSSQEFQVPSAIGDDEIVTCEACGKVANRELWERVKEGCDVSGCDTAETSTSMGLEVGHAFLLGRKYSKTFDVTFLDEHETKQTAVMGCYGIGVSRLISALAEVHHDAYGVRWPTVVAPYRVAIIVLHGGLRKKAQDLADTMAAHGEALYDELDAGALRGDVVLDTSDRSAGVKLAEAALIGYPYCVVVGKRHDSDRLEVKRRAADTKAGHAESEYMSASALVSEIMQECTRTP